MVVKESGYKTNMADEITIWTLLRAWFTRAHWIFGAGIICGALCFLIVLAVPPSYTASLSLVPASNNLEIAPDSSLTGFASALSGLGVNLPRSGSGSDFILFPQVVDTTAVANRLVQRKDILRRLFPGEYDPQTDQFRAPPYLMNSIMGGVFVALGQPAYIPPTVPRILDYLALNIKVTAATLTSPITTLEYSNKDPVFAKEFLVFVYQTVDGQFREWRVTRAKENSDYLEKKLNSVEAVDYRAALINQILPQQMTVMMNNPTSAFAARIVDGPTVGDRPTSPRPLAFIAGGTLIGAAFAMAIIATLIFIPNFFTNLRNVFRGPPKH